MLCHVSLSYADAVLGEVVLEGLDISLELVFGRLVFELCLGDPGLIGVERLLALA